VQSEIVDLDNETHPDNVSVESDVQSVAGSVTTEEEFKEEASTQP